MHTFTHSPTHPPPHTQVDYDTFKKHIVSMIAERKMMTFEVETNAPAHYTSIALQLQSTLFTRNAMYTFNRDFDACPAPENDGPV